MRRNILATVGLTCVIAILSRAAVHGEDKVEKKAVTKKDVKEMMTKAHKGDQSPFANLQKELKNETPDWARVGTDVKTLTEMADTLGACIEIQSYSAKLGPWRYIDSTKALDKAARDKDHKAATAALTKLRQSCSSCHYGIPK